MPLVAAGIVAGAWPGGTAHPDRHRVADRGGAHHDDRPGARHLLAQLPGRRPVPARAGRRRLPGRPAAAHGGFELLHLAGAVLGAAGFLVAAWRFLRDKDLIAAVAAGGHHLNLGTSWLARTPARSPSRTRVRRPAVRRRPGRAGAGRGDCCRGGSRRCWPCPVPVTSPAAGDQVRQPTAARPERGDHLLAGGPPPRSTACPGTGPPTRHAGQRGAGHHQGVERDEDPAAVRPRPPGLPARHSAGAAAMVRPEPRARELRRLLTYRGTEPFTGFTGVIGFTSEKNAINQFLARQRSTTSSSTPSTSGTRTCSLT